MGPTSADGRDPSLVYPSVWATHEASAGRPATRRANDSKQLASARRRAESAWLAMSNQMWKGSWRIVADRSAGVSQNAWQSTTKRLPGHEKAKSPPQVPCWHPTRPTRPPRQR